MKKSSTISLLAASLAFPLAAMAHISIENAETQRGAFKAVFKVPHGCDGSPTTAIKIEIPEGVIGVKPMPKPGWNLALEKGAYARTYDYFHGSKVSEGVKTVTWAGGKLLNEHFDEFVLSLFLTDAFEAGSAVPFPVEQTCETGSVRWSEIAAPGQDPHALKAPAPVLRIAAADAPARVTKTGDITIETPWSRATPGGAKVGAGYLRITNGGTAPDTLTGATSPVAESVEIHEMTMTDGVMRMRQLADGLEIKPGETVDLKPGGTHVMFMGLKKPFAEGDAFPLTLTFKSAPSVDVEFSVAPLGAAGPEQKHH